MSTEHVTSTGHDLSDTAWLDQHFNFSREAYEAMVRWVGFQPGWHVLDAGCGGGGYLPVLAEQVGPTGKLSALDLAPENVAAVEARIKAQPMACSFEARVGSVVELPYPDATFDAVWNASVMEYLPSDGPQRMFAEFKRVTKSGGLVAIKFNYLPGYVDTFMSPPIWWRLLDALTRNGTQVFMEVVERINEFPERLRGAGFADVRRRFFTLEKYGPLNANDCAFRVSAWKYFANCALNFDLPPSDHAVWRTVADTLDETPFLSPDYFVHGHWVLVVGRVP